MKLIHVLSCAALLLATSAIAGTPINETRPLDATAKVSISNVSGSVTVRGWGQNRIEITGTLGDGAKPLVVTGDQHALTIKVEAARKGGWLNFGGDASMKPTTLKVSVPRAAALDIDVVSANADLADLAGGKLEVDSVSGEVHINATSPAVDVDSVSGNIRIEGQADKLDLETVSGDIHAPAAGSRDVSLESVSGDIRFGGGALTELEASTVSGDLSVQAGLAPGGKLSIDSMSGDIAVVLPKATSAKLEASTFSGDIESTVGTVQQPEHGPGSSLHATLGDGDGRIKLESFSGDVRVRQAD